jgi:hypothetical protein
MPQSSELCTLDRVTLVLRPLSLNMTVRLFVLSPMLKVFENACDVGLQARARAECKSAYLRTCETTAVDIKCDGRTGS